MEMIVAPSRGRTLVKEVNYRQSLSNGLHLASAGVEGRYENMQNCWRVRDELTRDTKRQFPIPKMNPVNFKDAVAQPLKHRRNLFQILPSSLIMWWDSGTLLQIIRSQRGKTNHFLRRNELCSSPGVEGIDSRRARQAAEGGGQPRSMKLDCPQSMTFQPVQH